MTNSPQLSILPSATECHMVRVVLLWLDFSSFTFQLVQTHVRLYPFMSEIYLFITKPVKF